ILTFIAYHELAFGSDILITAFTLPNPITHGQHRHYNQSKRASNHNHTHRHRHTSYPQHPLHIEVRAVHLVGVHSVFGAAAAVAHLAHALLARASTTTHNTTPRSAGKQRCGAVEITTVEGPPQRQRSTQLASNE